MKYSVLSLALAACTCHVQAEIKLASPFTSHTVLQRELPVPVWGQADPGEEVSVEFAGQKQAVTAGPDGCWRIELAPMKASTASRKLKVTGSKTAHPLVLDDVLVGEVWLCSGQSNMDFTVAKTPKYYFAGVTNEAEEVAAANYPTLRMFTGDWTRAYEPQQSVGGTWKPCTPENVREFCAVGYFFARDLQKELKVPVGIVTLTYGASTAQAWVRREAIAANPQLKPLLEAFDEQVKNYVPPTEAELNTWQAAAEKAKASGRRAPRRSRPDPVQDQHNPTVMFNGMIAPFVGFALRGVLWYQGESITAPRDLFPLWNETLIKDWRSLWGRELPFYFCQLAALENSSNSPQVREWQAEALKLPNTAMAVTIDIGDRKNVHPRDKAPLGNRLARIALARDYDRKIEYSGPQCESVAAADGALRLKFSHAASGLETRGGPLKTFEVAGADGKFVPAEARVEGDTVVVRSAKVAAPTSARYAWAGYPDGCNFYNGAGLPAAPFRITK